MAPVLLLGAGFGQTDEGSGTDPFETGVGTWGSLGQAGISGSSRAPLGVMQGWWQDDALVS